MTTPPDSPALGRRGLILGAGAAVLAAGVLASPEPALAQTPQPKGDGTAAGRVHATSSPVGTALGSAPISGYTYKAVSLYDFRPFQTTGQWAWGGSGAYSAVLAGPMRATVEIPAGALVRDVEYYVYNGTTSSTFASSYIWVPGVGAIYSIGASATIPTGSQVTATRAEASLAGPYPLGSVLIVSLDTTSNGTIQINGARVGFQLGTANTGLLDAPYRAYDSRTSGGKIAAGSTRTITLPASIVPPGTTGVLANITATLADAQGFLKVFSGAVAEPSASALNYSKSVPIANAMTVAVSSSRQLKIRASAAVHVIVDITGTIA